MHTCRHFRSISWRGLRANVEVDPSYTRIEKSRISSARASSKECNSSAVDLTQSVQYIHYDCDIR